MGIALEWSEIMIERMVELLMDDTTLFVNVVTFCLIAASIQSKAGHIAIAFASFYGAYIVMDLYWLMLDYPSQSAYIQNEAAKVMHILGAIIALIVMFYLVMYTIFHEEAALLNFCVCIFLLLAYIVPDIMNAGLLNTRLNNESIDLYTSIQEYPLYVIDLVFVAIGWHLERLNEHTNGVCQ